jgi:enamine deaminase RidA (YjgF/YER057c/UK114 family)
MSIQRFMVPGEPVPFSHYCHVVRAGAQIFISGAVGIAANGSIPESTVEQFELAMKSLDNCLRHAGGAPEHVVKVNIYMTRIGERGLINPFRQAYFGEHRPASTLVEVTALVDPRLSVEIEAIAVIPE